MGNIPTGALVNGVINIFALIGIIVSIIVWKIGKKSKKAACAIYMISLALTDLFAVVNDCVLIILGGQVLSRGQIESILNKNEFSCKFILYSVIVAPQMSAWITVAIAIERMLYVSFPVKMYQSNAKRRCVIISCIMFLVSLALNASELIFPKIHYIKYHNGTIPVCTGSAKIDLIRSISYGFFTALLPLFSLIVCNAVILIKMCCRKGTAVESIPRQPNVRNITLIVVSVSALHCLSTSPIAIYVLCQRLLNFSMNENLLKIFGGFYNINNRLNFVLYYLLGTDFREDLKTLCRHMCQNLGSKCRRGHVERVVELRRF